MGGYNLHLAHEGQMAETNLVSSQEGQAHRPSTPGQGECFWPFLPILYHYNCHFKKIQ